MFEISKRTFSHYGVRTYDYAIVETGNGFVVKSGFENEWQARLWFLNDSGFSIVLLK